MREDGAADDEVLFFSVVNDSFSIVCEVTYSLPSHESSSILVVASYLCTKVSKTSCRGTSSTVLCSE